MLCVFIRLLKEIDHKVIDRCFMKESKSLTQGAMYGLPIIDQYQQL